jgi:hypothetical protein
MSLMRVTLQRAASIQLDNHSQRHRICLLTLFIYIYVVEVRWTGWAGPALAAVW